MADDAEHGVCSGGEIYQLRVVIAGISPLIWRRLLVTAETTIAQLHTIVQTVFGWSGEHLHRFTVHGREFGSGELWCAPGARVRLVDLGLREKERFTYSYNFFADWQVDLRVEQIRAPEPGKAYPRCTAGRRAGPPEGWGGPWEFAERTQAHLVFDALRRAAQIMGKLLNAGDERVTVADVLGDDLDELGELMPLLGLEQFDRRACNKTLATCTGAEAVNR